MSATLTWVSFSAWCLILRKKWHSVRYTPPNSECDRLSQEPQLDFYRQHMLQHMLGTPLYSICNLKSDTVLFELVDVYKQHVTTCVTDTTPECDWSSSRWLNWMSSGSTSYSPPGSHIGSTVYPEQSILYLVWRDFQFFIAEVCVLHNKNVMKPSVFESLNLMFTLFFDTCTSD